MSSKQKAPGTAQHLRLRNVPINSGGWGHLRTRSLRKIVSGRRTFLLKLFLPWKVSEWAQYVLSSQKFPQSMRMFALQILFETCKTVESLDWCNLTTPQKMESNLGIRGNSGSNLKRSTRSTNHDETSCLWRILTCHLCCYFGFFFFGHRNRTWQNKDRKKKRRCSSGYLDHEDFGDRAMKQLLSRESCE